MKFTTAGSPATATTVHRGSVVNRLGETRDDSPSHIPVQRRLALVVTPAPEQPGHFTARLDGASKVLCTSRAPFLDSARVLLAEGYDPSISLEMLHEGAANFTLRALLGVAANLTVEESAHGPAFRCYRIGSPSAVAAPPIARRSDRRATHP